VPSLMTVSGQTFMAAHTSVLVLRRLGATIPRVLGTERGRRWQHEPIGQKRMQTPITDDGIMCRR
jgi:hypothetical protein